MKLFTFISAGAFIFLSGFIMKKQADPLFETQWHLKKIYTEEGVRQVDIGAFLRFDREKKSVSGNGSCNSLGGNAYVSRKTIHFENMFSTKMFCKDVQAIEDLFLKQLNQVNRYKVSANKLRLYQGKKLLLEFMGE